MRYCDNADCEYGDEPLERLSDYHIIDGALICIGCSEADLDAQEWDDANAELAEVDTVSLILSGRR